MRGKERLKKKKRKRVRKTERRVCRQASELGRGTKEQRKRKEVEIIYYLIGREEGKQETEKKEKYAIEKRCGQKLKAVCVKGDVRWKGYSGQCPH